MDARLNLYENAAAMKVIKHLSTAGRLLGETGVPRATQELVKLRASQMDDSTICNDMHYKEAVHAGEDPVKLNMVAAWREATVFTEAERAALELAEQGTRIADAAGGVSDEAWADACAPLRRGAAGRLGHRDRDHQHVQPVERHDPPARG